MDANRGMEVLRGANMESFAERVKESMGYPFYKSMVESGKKDTADFLEMTFLLEAMKDEEASLMMHKLGHQLLFAFIDQRLRLEIIAEVDVESVHS